MKNRIIKLTLQQTPSQVYEQFKQDVSDTLIGSAISGARDTLARGATPEYVREVAHRLLAFHTNLFRAQVDVTNQAWQQGVDDAMVELDAAVDELLASGRMWSGRVGSDYEI